MFNIGWKFNCFNRPNKPNEKYLCKEMNTIVLKGILVSDNE